MGISSSLSSTSRQCSLHLGPGLPEITEVQACTVMVFPVGCASPNRLASLCLLLIFVFEGADFEFGMNEGFVVFKKVCLWYIKGAGLDTSWLIMAAVLCHDSKKLHPFYESVDLVRFSFEIKAYEKNNRRHIVDIPRIIFFI